MKIMFLAPSLGSGGAERTIQYLSAYMAAKGHAVEVVSISDNVFYALEGAKLTTLGVGSQCSNAIERITNIIKRFARINRHVRKTRPDVVVCMLPETAKFLLGKRRYTLITSERNNPELDGDSNLKIKLFRKSDGIVFQTQRAKDWYPADIQSKGVVIHNAVGNPLVKKVGNVSERRKVISAVGRLTEQKDYPTLLEAFKTVRDRHSDYTLEIYGDGPDKDKLERLAARLGIADGVEFKGANKEAVLKIADSSCYVLSSKYEGMPNALMEAMAIGLPCVSTDCPNGPAELIENGNDGLLVPVGDSDAMAESICRMIENKDFAAACGLKARKILESHSVDEIAEKYTDYILSVVRKGN